MKKEYIISFIDDLDIKIKLTDLQLYDLIRNKDKKVRAYKLYKAPKRNKTKGQCNN